MALRSILRSACKISRLSAAKKLKCFLQTYARGSFYLDWRSAI